jgi:hypothetical protein
VFENVYISPIHFMRKHICFCLFPLKARHCVFKIHSTIMHKKVNLGLTRTLWWKLQQATEKTMESWNRLQVAHHWLLSFLWAYFWGICGHYRFCDFLKEQWDINWYFYAFFLSLKVLKINFWAYFWGSMLVPLSMECYIKNKNFCSPFFPYQVSV